MNGNKRGDTFDEALTAAFDEYAGRMLSSMPSDRELSKRYLVPEKTALEIRKRLRKRLRRKRLRSSKAFIYFRRIFAVNTACIGCYHIGGILRRKARKVGGR